VKVWLKNTANKPDAMLSFAFGGFAITGLAVILAFLGDLNVGNFSFKLDLNASHVALLTLFLGATLTAYVNRRNAKDKSAAKLKELRLRSELGMSTPKEDVEE